MIVLTLDKQPLISFEEKKPLTFSMFVSELKSLHQTEYFISWPSHRQVIDCDLTQDPFVINNK